MKKGEGMQFRRIAAVAGSALLAGATLATAGLAATVNTVGEITTKMGNAKENFPIFVIGENAAASDVAGAIDIAVRLAANYKTQESVSVEGVETTVSGGYLLETETSKLHYKDAINKAVKVLTSNEVSELESGTVEDENGKKYNYEQYIRVGGKTITFGDPVTTDTTKEAVYFVQLGTNPTPDSDYLVQAEVFLDNALNVTKAKGKKITLFGQEFTIAPESTDSKLVLYKSSDKVTIAAGETATITVGDTSYTAEVIGIVDSSTAVVKINGVTKEVTEGNSYDFGGVNVYIESVFYYKVPTETGEVVLSAGADKYVIQNGQPVKVGQDEDVVKGTKVSTDYSGYQLSYLKVAFDAPDSQNNYIRAGEAWTDPVFGTIKVAFNGLDSTSTENINIEPSSTNGYRVVFTDKNGNAVNLEWAYDSDPTTGSDAVLADSNNYAYNVIEGGAVGLNEYTFLAAAEGFERIVQVTSIDAIDYTGQTDKGKIVLRDVVSGTEFEVNLEEGATADDGIMVGKKIIDGQEYFIQLNTGGADDTDVSNDQVVITWDPGAGYGNTGNKVTLYPILRTSKGAMVVLTKADAYSATADASGVGTTESVVLNKTLVLPTGEANLVIYAKDTDGATAGVQLDARLLVNGVEKIAYDAAGTTSTSTTVTIGNVEYFISFSEDDTADTVTISLSLSKQDGTNELTTPAIMIVEEKDANDAQNAVIIPISSNYAGSLNKVDLADPIFTDSSASTFKQTGDNEDKAVDVYGVTVYRTNTNDQDNIAITYPDNQLTAKVAVGSNPQFTKGGGETVTTEKVIKIESDIAKLDTEVDETMKQDYDLIVVGGPCVNRVAAELLGDVTVFGKSPECDNLFASVAGENAALVKVFPNFYAEGKTAVLVAGWDRKATKKAATMLQSGQLDDYASEAVRIVDSTVEELTVEEATATEEQVA